MTLTMMIVAPWGVWACSDHRLTPLDGQGDIIDRSVKQIVLRTADGEVVITYAGIGSVDVHRGEDQWEQDVHISEWLRRLLRNDNWNLNQVQTMIRHWATANGVRRGRPEDGGTGSWSGASAGDGRWPPRSPTPRGRPDLGPSPASRSNPIRSRRPPSS